MSKRNLRLMLVDEKTGEMYETDKKMSARATITTHEPSTAEQREYYRQLNEQRSISKKLGGFIMVLYYDDELLFNDELGLSQATISRLMMLATFIDYENRVVLEVPKTKKTNDRVEYMTRNNIMETLNIKPSTLGKFMCETTKAGILMKDKNSYYLSSEFFYKGEIGLNKRFSKLYVEPLRQIYNNLSQNNQKTFSHIFQLMPFVHWETNCIVKHRCASSDNMEVMSLEDIARMLKIGYSENNRNTLKRTLFEYEFEFEENTYYVFNLMTRENKGEEVTYFVINPMLYTSTKNIREFKAAKKKCQK